MHLSEFMNDTSLKESESQHQQKEQTCSFVEMMETPQMTEDEPEIPHNHLEYTKD